MRRWQGRTPRRLLSGSRPADTTERNSSTRSTRRAAPARSRAAPRRRTRLPPRATISAAPAKPATAPITWPARSRSLVAATQTSPTAPPMAKQIALSWNGGTGAEPTVNSARSAQSRTARNPMAVARYGDMARPLYRSRRAAQSGSRPPVFFLEKIPRRAARPRHAGMKKGRPRWAAPVIAEVRVQTKNCAPLAEMVEPLMKVDSSEARNTTQRAISSGLPRRPAGIWAMIASRTFSGTAITISVAM